MALSQMNTRKQTIILLVIGSLIAGAYGVLRYTPEQKALTALSSKLEKTKEHIEAPKFPDEPNEDGEELKNDAEALEKKLEYLQTEVESYASTLAPTDSQNVMLKISQAARAANVKFIENVPYLVNRRVALDAKETKAVSNKKLTERQKRNQRKRERRRAKKQRKAQGIAAVGTIPKEGELIDRLVNDLDEARPLQKVSVEGNFENLLKFIQSMQAMPWQVTIVKLDIDVKIQTPLQGMPQPLMVKMIIGM